MSTKKVFGIGLSHTGTRSLNAALEALGIASIHWPVDRTTYRELSTGQYRLTVLETYQAITDITVAPFYAQLDRTYPASKFILTLRDKDAWLRSMAQLNATWRALAHTGMIRRTLTHLYRYYRGSDARRPWETIRDPSAVEFFRIATYGGIAFQDEARLAEVYDTHYRNVTSYFEDRPGDLLLLDICNGEGWEKLCPFLDKPMLHEPFPNIRDIRRQ